MRLTKQEIAEFRNGFVGSSKITALCDMADELLETDSHSHLLFSALSRAKEDRDAWKQKYDEFFRGRESVPVSEVDRKTAEIEEGKRKHQEMCDTAELLATANYRAMKAGENCDDWNRRAESSEALMDNNIRDLRSICETLAKRIAALEGFNDIPSPFTPSSFWRASTKSMSIDERKGERRKIVPRYSSSRQLFWSDKSCYWITDCRVADRRGLSAVEKPVERRRHWVADRRQREPVYMSGPGGHYTHYSDGQHWVKNRRQGPKDRRIVMTCTYGRAFWRQADKGYVVMQDERKRQRRQIIPHYKFRPDGHTCDQYSDGTRWQVERRGTDRRKPK